MNAPSASAATNPVELSYVEGTLELRGLGEHPEFDVGVELKWDKRSTCLRCPAFGYSDVVRALVRAKRAFVDRARDYRELELQPIEQRQPRPYQREAISPRGSGQRGEVTSSCRRVPVRLRSP
ncbi:MAG: hypothetical protein QM784_27450 [Polyangiaceae bacterium]